MSRRAPTPPALKLLVICAALGLAIAMALIGEALIQLAGAP